ncbi:MAG TPA: hypothetical protein VF402_00300 [Asticcacaulis sp.]
MPLAPFDMILVIAAAIALIALAYNSAGIVRFLKRPWGVSGREIEAKASEMLARNPDAAYRAYLRHEQAWYDQDGAAQIYWLRIRFAIWRKRKKWCRLGDSNT